MRRGLQAISRVLIVLGIALVGIVVAVPSTGSATTTSGSVSDYVTFYGWVDNSPPGPAIAHPCIHQTAGGVGTYSNPVTFAEHIDLKGPWCQIIYVPFLEKYFIHEDQCNPCGGVDKNHVDLWMGGDANSTTQPEKGALLACEDQWTERHTTVILDPPSTEPVDTTPLFTPPTSCHGGEGD
jgi:hypothetical protein